LKVGMRLRGGQRKKDGKQAKQTHRSTLVLRRKGDSGVWQPEKLNEVKLMAKLTKKKYNK